jgi:quinol monooxygenase YgiN
MFHHIVLMQFTAQADQAFFDAVQEYADRIRRSAPGLERYVFRRNVASRSDGLAFAIVGSFATSADHDAYQACALHQEMKAYMTPYIQRIVVCDVDEQAP